MFVSITQYLSEVANFNLLSHRNLLPHRNRCGLRISTAHWWSHCLLTFRLLGDDFDHWWYNDIVMRLVTRCLVFAVINVLATESHFYFSCWSSLPNFIGYHIIIHMVHVPCSIFVRKQQPNMYIQIHYAVVIKYRVAQKTSIKPLWVNRSRILLRTLVAKKLKCWI